MRNNLFEKSVMNLKYLALALSLLTVSAAGFFDGDEEFRADEDEHLDRNMTCGGFCVMTGDCMSDDMMADTVKTFSSPCQDYLESQCGAEGGNYAECVMMALNSSAVCPSDDFESCMSCHEICEADITKEKCFNSCLNGDDCWSEEELERNIDSYSVRCQYCLLKSCGPDEVRNLECFFPAFLEECSFVCPQLSANDTKRVESCINCVEHCDRQGGEFHDGDDDDDDSDGDNQDEDHYGDHDSSPSVERDDDDSYRSDGGRRDNEEDPTTDRRKHGESYQDTGEHHNGGKYFDGDNFFAAMANILGFGGYHQSDQQDDDDHRPNGGGRYSDQDEDDSFTNNESRGYRGGQSDDDDDDSDRRQYGGSRYPDHGDDDSYGGGRYSDQDEDDSFTNNESRGYRGGQSDDDDSDRRQYGGSRYPDHGDDDSHGGGRYSDQDEDDSFTNNESRGYRGGQSDDDDDSDRRQYGGSRYPDHGDDDSYTDKRWRGNRGQSEENDDDANDERRNNEDDNHGDESDEDNEKCIKTCFSTECPSINDMKKFVLKLPKYCRRCVHQNCGEEIYDSTCSHDVITGQCSQNCPALSTEQKKKETDCVSCMEACDEEG